MRSDIPRFGPIVRVGGRAHLSLSFTRCHAHPHSHPRAVGLLHVRNCQSEISARDHHHGCMESALMSARLAVHARGNEKGSKGVGCSRITAMLAAGSQCFTADNDSVRPGTAIPNRAPLVRVAAQVLSACGEEPSLICPEEDTFLEGGTLEGPVGAGNTDDAEIPRERIAQSLIQHLTRQLRRRARTLPPYEVHHQEPVLESHHLPPVSAARPPLVLRTTCPRP